MSAPLDNFPDRHDFERGCMPDGSPLRFASATLYEGWPAPIPGKSNIEAHARKQDAPENCGSIYTPEKDSIPITGVPCPVPDAPDAALEAQVDKCKLEHTAFTYNRLSEINNGMMRMFRIGIEASEFVAAHPELRDAEPEQSAPREQAMPREPQVAADDDKIKDMVAAAEKGHAQHEADQERWAQMDEAQAPCPEPAGVDAGSASRPSPVMNAGDHLDDPSRPDTGGGARATATATSPAKTRGYRVFRVPEKECASAYARCKGLMDLAVRIHPRLAKTIMEQEDVGQALIEFGHKRDLKSEFLQDRAVVLVKNMLLYCDDMFRDLGFGGWMPFRFPDQWLAFTSLMRKVLAANGLLCPKGPNHWRKFLEETPEVEEDKLQMPKSLAPTKKYAAVESVEEVIRLANEKIKLDPAARKRFNQRFAMGP